MDQNTRFCEGCRAQVLSTRKPVNHILHLILTLTTCGFWAVPWVLLCLFRQPWRCSRCGLQIGRALPLI